MENSAITLSKLELDELLSAYKSMQKILFKVLPKEEIYTDEFLIGMEEAENDINNNNFHKVNSFEDFVK